MTTLLPGPSRLAAVPVPEILAKKHRRSGSSAAAFIVGNHFSLGGPADPGRSAKRPQSCGIVGTPRPGVRW